MDIERLNDPYRIVSPFDSQLEIVILETRERFHGKKNYVWELRKWYWSEEKRRYLMTHALTVRDLILAADLIEEAKRKMRGLYRPLLEDISADKLEEKEHDRQSEPWMFDRYDPEPLFPETPLAKPARKTKYPWED